MIITGGVLKVYFLSITILSSLRVEFLGRVYYIMFSKL